MIYSNESQRRVLTEHYEFSHTDLYLRRRNGVLGIPYPFKYFEEYPISMKIN